jgi:hypothetical protein
LGHIPNRSNLGSRDRFNLGDRPVATRLRVTGSRSSSQGRSQLAVFLDGGSGTIRSGDQEWRGNSSTRVDCDGISHKVRVPAQKIEIRIVTQVPVTCVSQIRRTGPRRPRRDDAIAMEGWDVLREPRGLTRGSCAVIPPTSNGFTNSCECQESKVRPSLIRFGV